MIVLDTSVLSLLLRRRKTVSPEPREVGELRRLVEGDIPLFVPGIVLQELLSGVHAEAEFDRLRFGLEGFPCLFAEERHHLLGAQISNRCRAAGRSFSTVDCLIAALTLGIRAALWTADSDFKEMAPFCGLKLH